MSTKLLRQIKNSLPDLRKSEKIVGEYILKDPKSIITKKAIYSDFKVWFKEYHEGNKLPRCEQLYRFVDEQIGKGTTRGWKNVVFKNEDVDEDYDAPVNDLDI